MTSLERHKLRYQRRIAKRKAKKNKKLEICGFDQMLSYNNWIEAAFVCKKNVYFKPSVQLYMDHPLVNIHNAIQSIKNGKNPYKINTKRIIIKERGKERKIEPISISKRHGEHVFCDNIYMKYFKDFLIYDNGASIQGRGTDFARRRLLSHLEHAIREYGDDFYILQFDFKSFFDSIKYSVCEDILKKHFNDERIVHFSLESIKEYTKGNIKIMETIDPDLAKQMQADLDDGNGKGICLGSQNSQITALIIPNKLDHYIKDICGMKYYCRYMDDGIIIHNDKEVLKQLLINCEKICEELGLTFNKKKTRIVKSSKGFTFLKTKYNILPGGKILRRPHKSGIIRNRRKLKRFVHLVTIGKMSEDDVFNSFQAYYNHTKKIGKSFKTRKQMMKQYRQLFGDYKIDKINR